MPRLRNFCLIKDTTTGKYLVAVGSGGYYGRPRNNAWGENGNYYKATQIEKKIREAARIVAEIEWHRQNPGAYPKNYYHWNSPEYKQARDTWRERYAECCAWVGEHMVIPDTWVVVKLALGPNGEAEETPAKEWKS